MFGKKTKELERNQADFAERTVTALILLDNKINDLKLEDKNEVPNEDPIKVVYALNLCTVSISQIVDYNDIGILEQEYEAILNNLNIENMPKDEPLLKILKQILDTITFFRIQEGQKKFIEKDYQQKMKSAIWKSVPNLSVIVASGNPFVAIGALATQVGIGYMNYRKEKDKIKNEREKQEWELQKSAMEQFNALRRELFDTAWRLADKYGFDDKYRLTEKQIKQYNEILLESDCFRKYKRLEAINKLIEKNEETGEEIHSFDAYAPYYYYLGDALCQCARLVNELEPDEDKAELLKKEYISEAKKWFNKFKTHNNYSPKNKNEKYSLLRIDQIASACYLEHIDLLDFNNENDIETIKELLDETIEVSGNANDILQICAMDYLKLGDYDNAEKYLRILVTEHFNENTNAQLLSRLYLNDALTRAKNYNEIFKEYETLKRFVSEEYLYPLPEAQQLLNFDENHFFSVYNEAQRKILLQKYALVFNALIKKYVIKCNKSLQNPGTELNKLDSYFLDDEPTKENRQQEIIKLFKTGQKSNYIELLENSLVTLVYLENINEFYGAFQNIDYLVGLGKDLIEEKLKANKNVFNNLDETITETNGKGPFREENLKELFNLTFESLISDYIKKIASETLVYVKNLNSLNDFIDAECHLRDLCVKEKIEDPDFLFQNKSNKICIIKKDYFNTDEYLDENIQKEKERLTKLNMQIEIIKKYQHSLSKDDNKLHLCIKGNVDFSNFIYTHTISNETKKDLLAVLENNTWYKWWKWHILFTINEVWIYRNDDWKSHFNYSHYSDILEKYESVQSAIIENDYVCREQLEKLFYELSANETNDKTNIKDETNHYLNDETMKDYDFINNGLSTDTVKLLGDNLFKCE